MAAADPLFCPVCGDMLCAVSASMARGFPAASVAGWCLPCIDQRAAMRAQFREIARAT